MVAASNTDGILIDTSSSWGARIVGCRLVYASDSQRLRHRVWRWLTKRNRRIVSVEGSTITWERCR